MKRLLATTLLLGYILLVPFCFFGGTFFASADMMHMAAGAAFQMDDCGTTGCAHANAGGGMDTVVHHVGMYYAISQTPFLALSILFALLLALAFGVVRNHWFSTPNLPAISSCRPRQRVAPLYTTRQRILTWLALFESSPNFA